MEVAENLKYHKYLRNDDCYHSNDTIRTAKKIFDTIRMSMSITHYQVQPEKVKKGKRTYDIINYERQETKVLYGSLELKLTF